MSNFISLWKLWVNIDCQKKDNNNILKFLYNPAKKHISHCSYCFKDINNYKNKLKSFAHRGFNRLLFISILWIFKSNNYRRIKIGSPLNGYEEPYKGWKYLITDDEKLKYLFGHRFMFPIN